MMGDIKGDKGGIMGLPRPTFKGKGKTPWVQNYQGVSSGMSFFLSGASLWYVSAPGWGIIIHLVGFYPYGGLI
jgi:hypothetical protein